MRIRGEFIFGGFLLILGLAILIGNLSGVKFEDICWPTALILLGIWLLVRPRLISPGTGFRLMPFGNLRRSGSWKLEGEEVWMFIGDTRYDLSQAEIPAGETVLRVFAFIGDVKIRMPQGVGLSVMAVAFINDTKILGQKRDSFLVPVEFSTPDYASAERKVRLETFFFIADIDVDPA